MDVINRQKARRITSFSAKVTEIDQLLADPNCDTIVLKTGVNQLENRWNNLSASYDELMDNLDAVVGDPTVTATAEDQVESQPAVSQTAIYSSRYFRNCEIK